MSARPLPQHLRVRSGARDPRHAPLARGGGARRRTGSSGSASLRLRTCHVPGRKSKSVDGMRRPYGRFRPGRVRDSGCARRASRLGRVPRDLRGARDARRPRQRRPLPRAGPRLRGLLAAPLRPRPRPVADLVVVHPAAGPARPARRGPLRPDGTATSPARTSSTACRSTCASPGRRSAPTMRCGGRRSPSTAARRGRRTG